MWSSPVKISINCAQPRLAKAGLSLCPKIEAFYLKEYWIGYHRNALRHFYSRPDIGEHRAFRLVDALFAKK